MVIRWRRLSASVTKYNLFFQNWMQLIILTTRLMTKQPQTTYVGNTVTSKTFAGFEAFLRSRGYNVIKTPFTMADGLVTFKVLK